MIIFQYIVMEIAVTSHVVLQLKYPVKFLLNDSLIHHFLISI